MQVRCIGACLVGFVVATAQMAAGQAARQPMQQVDARKVQRFCDVGFRFVETGIKFDLDKLFGLGLSVDPKVLQAVSSQAAVQIAALTQLCRFFAADLLSPQQFVDGMQKILEYAKDLEAVRSKVEEDAKVPVSKKDRPTLDAAVLAKEELGLTVESSIEVAGELRLVLRRLMQRYSCVCLPETPKGG